MATNYNNQRPQINLPGNINRYIFIAVAIFMLFFILSNTTFITIPAGSKGVLFKRFAGGIEKDKVYDQGFHVVAPWNDLIIYDVRINEGYEKMEVLSKNGLSIQVELAYRYNPISNKIGYLHDEIGNDYLDRIVKPEIRSATREVIGKYLPEELYSTQREAIQTEIFDRTAKNVSEKYIHLDAILISSLELPPKLKAAIEQKLQEEQMSFQYEFRLDKERKEAERRIIEARAKAEANKLLSASLTDKILRDKGVEATLELAKSPNSKVIVVGSGKDGLPLILGDN